MVCDCTFPQPHKCPGRVPVACAGPGFAVVSLPHLGLPGRYVTGVTVNKVLLEHVHVHLRII